MMSPLNMELIVKQWIESDDALADYPVSFDVPSTRPARFITVERVGGGSDGILDRPMIAVQVWDTSRWNASNAAMALVKPRLVDLWQHPNVGAVSIESVVNFPETVAPFQSRYQITVSMTVAVNG